VSFDHDPEHQRYAQTSLSGVTLYISGGGVLAERFAGTGGTVRWTNYLIVGGRFIGVHVENSDETTLTRYFHTDHLGSISVITDEAGLVLVGGRLSYDAWGLRRHPNGEADPSGSITSETTRGFTGHEHLAEVGLIHMNGRVYDPLLGRFGTPDPMTESPFSTQGWNRYSYVGNSPLNFTDPSGYCFMGCFWKPIFKAIGNFFKQSWRAIVNIAVTAACQFVTNGMGGPACAALGGFVAGITSGDLGLAIRGAVTAYITAAAMFGVGEITKHNPNFMSPAHLANMAGHALVGCGSSIMQGGRCGPGALSGAAGSFTSPLLRNLGVQRNLVAHAVGGGVASVAAGGNFANGAVTAAFGYLFNDCGDPGSTSCFGVPRERLGEGTLLAAWWQQWVRDFRVGVTFYFGYGLESTVGTGVGGGTGAVVTGGFINFGSTVAPDIEYGGFAMSAETLGFNPWGRGAFAGFNWGTVDDFKNAASVNATTPWIGGGVNLHPDLGISGMSVSQPGIPSGLSYGTTTTCIYSNLRSGC
jgi:RHS repeat-associated protein